MSRSLMIAVKLLAITPAWLAVPLVIWSVDPQGRLRPHPDDRTRAQLVSNGQAIVWPDAVNDRTFVRELIPLMPRREIVVLGSSRVFRIHQEAFAPRSLMNLGITCATLEELRGIVELLRQHDKLPDHLIVGIDPWTFNPRQLERSPDRCLRSAGAIIPSSPRREWQRVALTSISPAYFQLSLRSVMSPARVTAASVTDDADGLFRLGDGSFVLSEPPGTHGGTVRERVEARVQQAIHDGVWSEYVYDSGDELLRRAFADLIQSVPSATILLVPLHPTFYDVVRTEPGCQRAFEQETWLREFGDQDGIAVVGSFDPARCGMTADDFIDASHANEEAMLRFSREMAKGISINPP